MNSLGRGALALLLAATAGCAATRGVAGPGRDPALITAEEIRTSDARDAYEAVERLRPLWLRSRGERSLRTLSTAILVYLNDARLGELDTLRRIPVETITSIRYLDGPAAAARLSGIGSGHVEGAIVVATHR